MEKLTDGLVRNSCDPKKLGSIKPDVKGKVIILGNEGIFDIAEMAFSIRTNDHHVALVVPKDVDGFDLADKMIARATAKNTNNLRDYCYVFNYRRSEKPMLIVLPKGMGRGFKKDIDDLIMDLLLSLSKFNPQSFWEKASEEVNKTIAQFNKEQGARNSRSRLRREKIPPDGREAYVGKYIRENGKEIPYPALSEIPANDPEAQSLKEAAEKEYKIAKEEFDTVLEKLSKLTKEIPVKIFEEKTKIINEGINALKEKYSAHQRILKYLRRLTEDIINHLPLFDFTDICPDDCKPCRQGITEACKLHSKNGYFSRFAVNLLVDNGKQTGAPVVKVSRATCSELFGIKTEEHAHEGFGHYQHTGIVAGAFHKANHGFLIIEAAKLFRHTAVLDAFTSTLESNEVSIENLMSIIGVSDRSESLKPENVKLDLKVILIIDEMTYQILKGAEHWMGLTKFFEIKAKIEPDIPYNAGGVDALRHFLIGACQENGLRKPDKNAQARLVEYGQELIGSQTRISLQTKIFMNLLRQADYFAEKNEHKNVKKEDVDAAIEAKEKRHGSFQERFLESARLGNQVFNTSGYNTGDVNGLFVGKTPDGSKICGPTRITCNVGMGKEGMVSAERSDGPMHQKWFETVKGYILEKLGQKFPLLYKASFCFDQIYDGIE